MRFCVRLVLVSAMLMSFAQAQHVGRMGKNDDYYGPSFPMHDYDVMTLRLDAAWNNPSVIGGNIPNEALLIANVNTIAIDPNDTSYSAYVNDLSYWWYQGIPEHLFLNAANDTTLKRTSEAILFEGFPVIDITQPEWHEYFAQVIKTLIDSIQSEKGVTFNGIFADNALPYFVKDHGDAHKFFIDTNGDSLQDDRATMEAAWEQSIYLIYRKVQEVIGGEFFIFANGPIDPVQLIGTANIFPFEEHPPHRGYWENGRYRNGFDAYQDLFGKWDQSDYKILWVYPKTDQPHEQRFYEAWALMMDNALLGGQYEVWNGQQYVRNNSYAMPTVSFNTFDELGAPLSAVIDSVGGLWRYFENGLIVLSNHGYQGVFDKKYLLPHIEGDNFYNGTIVSEIGLLEMDGAVLLNINPTSVGENDLVISDYQLKQNYPNPFNPTTNISFSVPSNQHVSISIYDTNGKLIHVLLDRSVKAGDHQVTWDGRDYLNNFVTSGQYYYRLTAGDITINKKMILLK